MKTRFNAKVPDGSQLYGYNYNNYPIHKFMIFNNFDDKFPIFPNGMGDDYWHRECFRQRINSNVFAVEYVTEGVFIFNHNGIEVKCNPGEIFLVHFGSDSSMRCETLTATKKMVNMSGSLLQPMLGATGLDRIFCIRPADRSRIDRIFDELYSAGNFDGTGDFNLLSSLCYKLLLTLADEVITSVYPEELQKALSLIHRSLDSSLSLSDLSRKSGVSKATLNRLFSEYIKCSPVNYFITQKMLRAKTLLQYHPVKQVADMLNYSSSQYFSKEFKKHFGVSPKNFRCKPI